MPTIASLSPLRGSLRPRRAVARTRASRLLALLLGAVLTACGEPTRPEGVASLTIQAPATELASGAVATLSVTVTGTKGSTLTGRAVTWQSSDLTVATISGVGVVTAARNTGGTAAPVTMTATVEGVTGTLVLRVRPVPAATVGLAPSFRVLRVGEQGSFTLSVSDSTGALLTGRTATWSSSAPTVATVSTDGSVRAVAPGRATIRADVEGRSATADLFVAPPSGLAVIDAAPLALAPGVSLTLTGAGFSADAAGNRVLVGGAEATVLSATATQLVVRTPCALSGPAAIRVIRGVDSVSGPTATMTTPRRTLAPGQSIVLSDPGEAACNELPATGTDARYAVVAYSVATSPNTVVDVTLSGNPGDAPRLERQPVAPAATLMLPDDPAARAHAAHLERERALYQSLTASGAFARPTRARTDAAQVASIVVGDVRRLFYNFGGCRDTTVRITARAIYVGTYGIVWEDSANALQSTAVPALATAYARLGRVFDRDQYTTVRNTYGDPLLRDGLTDRDGRVSMVFTQKLNGSGAAAYVTSCDQAARGPAALASNEGEYFYGSVPTNPTPNVASTASPDGWYAFMVRTVVHEVKHIASTVARAAQNAPRGEESWLEEGTARHAEEVWARDSLLRVSWKGNTGWGSATSPGVFCDFNLANATCTAADTLRRPAWGMRRQLHEIRPKMVEPWNWSPYGDAAGQSSATFYNTTWSLVRYAIDRYGASDAGFLGALNRSTLSGVANLTQVAGVSIDRLLGQWGLALYADDWPGLAPGNPDLTFATWNLRSIYAGLAGDPGWRASYPTPYPLRPVPLTLGAFTATRTGLRGGAHAYFELTGTHTTPQLLALGGASGAALSPFVRLALVRLP